MRRSTFIAFALIVLVLGLLSAKSLLIAVPPVREHSAAGQFDAQRAKARLAFILGDQRPHPADTAADDQVRERLIALLGQMGLNPIVRDQLACNELYKARGVCMRAGAQRHRGYRPAERQGGPAQRPLRQHAVGPGASRRRHRVSRPCWKSAGC